MCLGLYTWFATSYCLLRGRLNTVLHHFQQAEMFLVSAAERRLLSQQEFCQSLSTMFTSTPVDNLGIHDNGFKKCCTELRENRGRSMQSWILRRLAGAFQSAPRSRHAPKPLAAFEHLYYTKQLRRQKKDLTSKDSEIDSSTLSTKDSFSQRQLVPTIFIDHANESPHKATFSELLQVANTGHLTGSSASPAINISRRGLTKNATRGGASGGASREQQ